MSRTVPELVDQQIRRWQAQRNAPVRVISSEGPRPDVVVMSRQIGTEAGAVAHRVSELLGLPLYDHAILEHIARNANVHLETIQTLDEHAQGRVEEYLGALLRERNLDRSEYLMVLARTVVSLWEHGPCVLMGHGSVHLVPREHALKARLIADHGRRARRLAEERAIPLERSRRELRRSDAELAAFHRRFFDEDAGDARHYDLIVDTGTLGIESSASLIASAYRGRFPGRAP